MGYDTLDTTTLVDDPIRVIRVQSEVSKACIVRVFSPETGLTFRVHPIGSEGLIIGRKPEGPGDVHIEDHRASRQHARIQWLEVASSHALYDLDSTNGTRLNGIEIEREILCLQDVIRVGNSLFVYCRTPRDDLAPNELLIGRSRVMQEVLDSIAQVAPTDLKVLLTGETGTGKELAACALHTASGRKGDFIPVNCGSFPGTLIESELFGYVKGAFSGADRTKEGLIATAHEGTLFLDEIGEFPLELQPRLLRVLHDQEVRRVGATHPEKVDVRFIAATNQDIFQMVETHRFRRDLLARLNEWPVHLPTLRERREDIGLLILHFLQQRQVEQVADQFDADLIEHMLRAPWPANVRELASAVARLSISMGSGSSNRQMLLKQLYGRTPIPQPEKQPPSDAPDRDRLCQILALFEDNISGVARYFGKERQQVYRWLERYNLREK